MFLSQLQSSTRVVLQISYVDAYYLTCSVHLVGIIKMFKRILKKCGRSHVSDQDSLSWYIRCTDRAARLSNACHVGPWLSEHSLRTQTLPYLIKRGDLLVPAVICTLTVITVARTSEAKKSEASLANGVL